MLQKVKKDPSSWSITLKCEDVPLITKIFSETFPPNPSRFIFGNKMNLDFFGKNEAYTYIYGALDESKFH